MPVSVDTGHEIFKIGRVLNVVAVPDVVQVTLLGFEAALVARDRVPKACISKLVSGVAAAWYETSYTSMYDLFASNEDVI